MRMHAERPRPRWPELDGLRAFAVLAVFLFHTGAPTAAVGFAGVDIFFVLSGFLITTVVVDELAEGRQIALFRFYARRVLRLYPALIALVAGCFAVAVVLRASQSQIAAGATAALLYVSNIWIYSRHETVVLQHTWTLALEEQFYVVWPLVLGVLMRRRRPLLAFAVVAAAAAAAVVAVTHLASGDAAAVSNSYVRAIGLPLGCALALLVARHGARANRATDALCLVALGALLVALFGLGGQAPQRWFNDGVSPAALATLPLLYGIVSGPPGLVSHVLANPVATWLGRRSYGFYLWHFPIVSLVVLHGDPSMPWVLRVAVALALAVVTSAASFRYIEAPFLRVKDGHARARAGRQEGAVVSVARSRLRKTRTTSSLIRTVGRPVSNKEVRSRNAGSYLEGSRSS